MSYEVQRHPFALWVSGIRKIEIGPFLRGVLRVLRGVFVVVVRGVIFVLTPPRLVRNRGPGLPPEPRESWERPADGRHPFHIC